LKMRVLCLQGRAKELYDYDADQCRGVIYYRLLRQAEMPVGFFVMLWFPSWVARYEELDVDS